MIENCPMRHENGNCIPAGGFCTANKNICEALLNAYRMGKAQLSKEGTTSDLISRTATIDAVNNAFDRETLLTGFVRSIAVRAIRDMPSVQSEPQWIPVSERLPEEQGYYITSNEYGGVIEDFYCDDYFWIADRNAYKVIAWMPKPEAYKQNK